MHDRKWSASEKKIARQAFAAALAGVMAEFKAKAAAAATPSDMWDVGNWLHRRRREIDELFDYRYSRLPWVFARLVREGYLDEQRLAGLSEDKLEEVCHLNSRLRIVRDG